MKNVIVVITSIVVLIYPLSVINILAQNIPLGYYNGYVIDLNLDKKDDIVLFFKTESKYILIVLINEANNYKSYVLDEWNIDTEYGNAYNMYVFPSYEKQKIMARRVPDAENKKEEIVIPSPFILLTIPESTSTLFYWDKGKFNQIWITI